MTDQDRRKRDLELLKGAVERDRDRDRRGAEPSGAKKPATGMMYRGQPVAGRGSGGRAPGAPGARGPAGPSTSSAAGSADVKEALSKITNLYNDGLISKAEYADKRAEILDRI